MAMAESTPSIEDRWPHTGAVLAGGQSRRMGEPKEGIVLWDGQPMIQHVLATLGRVCRHVVIIGQCRGFEIPDGSPLVRLPDLRPGGGPLAGIETLLRSGLDSGYLVVACDQPLLREPLLRRLVTAAGARPCFLRPEDGSWLGPFPGYFPAACLEQVDLALRRGVTSVRRVFAESDVTWVPISPEEQSQLKSIDSPADLAELLQSAPEETDSPGG